MFQRSRIVGRAIVTAEMQVLRCPVQISLLFDRRLSTSASPPPSYPGSNSTVPLKGIPSRFEQLQRLKSDDTYDVLIIGGGATGSGAALDAASRGLKVACIERGDFASETSSRSTKLIWAGIRYLATSAAGLLSKNLFLKPAETIKDFWGEFMMVVGCHRERRYMLEKQEHLTKWIPIAIPFDKYIVWPPPFGHPLFALFPLLAPFVLKFYDSLSQFSCPPSYVMGPQQAKEKFPQLSHRKLKFVSVFYEAQHNDARTNLAIALSAAEHGAAISNYVEATEMLFDGKKACGVKALDNMSGDEFDIRAKKVIFAGGPYTDLMRKMEDAEAKPAVQGASGSHVVLPGYYCPSDMGLLDYNTSDGRFLFFLPWQGHTLVGTTDKKCDAETSASAPEDEVQWILNECGKYLSKDLRVRRSDVLSAWRGWRPLAADPHAPPGAPVSRDHVISENPESGVIFIAGGKWTTWREMAEDVVNRITDKPCRTTEIKLLGGDGYNKNMPIRLTQKHGMGVDVAAHLSNTYGARAWDVCDLSRPTGLNWPKFGVPVSSQYPYIEAEVVYACREYACTVEDVLSRRTRLAFLNSEAAKDAIPRVAEIMAEELGWSEDIKASQMESAYEYISTYGGPVPDKAGASLRSATFRDIIEIFNAIDEDGSGFLDRTEVEHAATKLGFPMSAEELNAAFDEMDTSHDGRVSLEEFEAWWNGADDGGLREKMHNEFSFAKDIDDLKKVGGGAMLG
ncbi:hypothetical protein TrST_g8364 [Triparma strigata]|uniref:Glycerol-3-phosphate dehydrogenase n=1 Tax=Triparma strigata TaxID=1606541 RepID=A0A9W6ZTD8_9STRA|nr:hypothetical protein TrST_g8364 [Triparma strigata]